MINFLQTMLVSPLLANAASLKRNTLGRWPIETSKVEVIYLREYETFDDVARRRCS
jgi:hypothetical protein